MLIKVVTEFGVLSSFRDPPFFTKVILRIHEEIIEYCKYLGLCYLLRPGDAISEVVVDFNKNLACC